MRRICTQCKEEKPIEEFNFRDKKLGKRQGACRECTRNQVRRHIKANPEYYRDRARRRKQMLFQENRVFLLEYLSDKQCADCGESDPVVLQFDHLKDKKYTVAHMMGQYRWDKILKEIAKCEIRCANCHTRRTSKQLGWFYERV